MQSSLDCTHQIAPLKITQVADTWWTSTGSITHRILRENTCILFSDNATLLLKSVKTITPDGFHV